MTRSVHVRQVDLRLGRIHPLAPPSSLLPPPGSHTLPTRPCFPPSSASLSLSPLPPYRSSTPPGITECAPSSLEHKPPSRCPWHCAARPKTALYSIVTIPVESWLFKSSMQIITNHTLCCHLKDTVPTLASRACWQGAKVYRTRLLGECDSLIDILEYRVLQAGQA